MHVLSLEVTTMPKRKRSREVAPDYDTPATSAEELAARNERVVHEETMHATVGEVLAEEHPDEVPIAARAEQRAADEKQRASAPSEPRAEPRSEARTGPREARGVLRFLSPKYVVHASKDAAGELVDGVRKARHDLIDAFERARRCFGLGGLAR